jgi:hypothetical protein
VTWSSHSTCKNSNFSLTSKSRLLESLVANRSRLGLECVSFGSLSGLTHRLAEVVCMCVLGPMGLLIMRPVIIYCRFLLISSSKSLDFNLRPKKDRSRLGTLSVSSRSKLLLLRISSRPPPPCCYYLR